MNLTPEQLDRNERLEASIEVTLDIIEESYKLSPEARKATRLLLTSSIAISATPLACQTLAVIVGTILELIIRNNYTDEQSTEYIVDAIENASVRRDNVEDHSNN